MTAIKRTSSRPGSSRPTLFLKKAEAVATLMGADARRRGRHAARIIFAMSNRS